LKQVWTCSQGHYQRANIHQQGATLPIHTQEYQYTYFWDKPRNCYIAFFLQKVGEGFAEKGATLAQNGVSQAASSNRVLERHFGNRIHTAGKKTHPMRVYKICSEKSKNSTGKRERKETVWWCLDCKVPLCMPECFKLYHLKLNYL